MATTKNALAYHTLVLISGIKQTIYIPRANVIKIFTPVIYEFRNKLECLSMESFSSLVLFVGKARFYPIEEPFRYSNLG